MSNSTLHDLLENNPNVDVGEVQALIKKDPGAVMVKDNYGWLPLHYVAGADVSAEVIQLLITEYTDEVKEKDDHGKLRLQIAVENGASVEVTQLLTKEYPVKEKGEDGNLPPEMVHSR